MPAARRHTEGLALAVFAALTMGGGYAVARLAFQSGTNPLTITLIRVILLLACFAFLARAAGVALALPRRAAVQALLLGLLLVGGFYGNIASVQYMPVSLAVLIYNTYPLLIVLFEAAALRRWPQRRVVAASAVAILGIGLLLGVTLGETSALGVFWAGLGAFAGAFCTFWIGHRMGDVPVLAVMTHMMASGLAAVLVLVAAIGGLAWPNTGAGWGLALLLLFFQFVCVPAYWVSVPRIGAVVAGSFQNLVPVVGTAAAYFLYGETLGPLQLLGAVMVVGAVTVIVLARGRAPAAAPPA
jgi:drug/metabolite transporter (DMT)-like permease